MYMKLNASQYCILWLEKSWLLQAAWHTWIGFPENKPLNFIVTHCHSTLYLLGENGGRYSAKTAIKHKQQDCTDIKICITTSRRSTLACFGHSDSWAWVNNMHTINLTFKCLKGSPPVFFKDYFKVFRTVHNTRGSGHNLLLPKVRTETARKSFYFNGSKLFNNIASEMKDSKSVVIFKTRILELYRSKVF